MENFEPKQIRIPVHQETDVLHETAKVEEKIRDFTIYWNILEEELEKQKIDYPPVIADCPFIGELLDKYLPQFLTEAYQEDFGSVIKMKWKERVGLILRKIDGRPRGLSNWTRKNMNTSTDNVFNRREFLFCLGVSKEILVLACPKLVKSTKLEK